MLMRPGSCLADYHVFVITTGGRIKEDPLDHIAFASATQFPQTDDCPSPVAGMAFPTRSEILCLSLKTGKQSLQSVRNYNLHSDRLGV